MRAIESYFPDVKRYELFTGSKSIGNIRLYKRLGYHPFKEQSLNEIISIVFLEKIKK